MTNQEKIPYWLGKHHSDETKRKISEAKKGCVSWMKGRKLSLETRKKISEAKKGNNFKNSGQFRKGQTPWNINKPHSEESKRKMSESQKKRIEDGAIPWMKGKSMSEKTKEKLRHTFFQKGHKPWHAGKSVSELLNGKPHFNKGRKPSEKTIQAVRESRKNQIFPLKDTKPERMIQSALSIYEIKFEKHKSFKMDNGSYHQVDIFIEPNLCIEIDGCYWHSCRQCGFFYPKRIEKDLSVNKTLQSKGYQVIRFWEHEINENINRCIERIRLILL